LFRLKAAKEHVLKSAPDANVKTVELDLGIPDSIKAAAKTINDLGVPIDVLINNAGVMASPYVKSEFPVVEQQMGTVGLSFPVYREYGILLNHKSEPPWPLPLHLPH